jgi:hypothetical protein
LNNCVAGLAPHALVDPLPCLGALPRDGKDSESTRAKSGAGTAAPPFGFGPPCLPGGAPPPFR